MLTHLQPLIDKSRTRNFSAGSTILYMGEVPQTAHILARGVVRVFSISDQGEEQIVMYHTEGEFFPSPWIFNKAPSTLFFYEAVTECSVAFVPRADLITYMQKQPERLLAMLDYFTTNYSASLIHVNALEQHRAHDKLLYILYYLCKRHGKTKGKMVTIPFALTHQNLASLVGVTRETAATEMNNLKKQGILTYDNQLYEVHLERLLNAMNEDGFKGIDIQA
jgi:CRP/FNR family cyclic AMP-dependent transcriptional regulator